MAYALDRQAECLTTDEFENIPGHGVRARVGDCKVTVGNRRWFEESGMDLSYFSVQESTLSEQGKTPVYLGIDGEAAALFGIADRPRENAGKAIERLRKLGIEPMMVTGDTEQTARYIAEEVGIERVIAHARPERKLDLFMSCNVKARESA